MGAYILLQVSKFLKKVVVCLIGKVFCVVGVRYLVPRSCSGGAGFMDYFVKELIVFIFFCCYSLTIEHKSL